MTDKLNRIMQTNVDYQIQEQKGSVALDLTSISYDIDTTDNTLNTTVFTYGQFVALGTNKGTAPTASSTAVGNLLGVIKYQNSGVIDDGGFKYGTYTNVPVLKKGAVWVAASGAMDLDSTVYLIVDPTKTGYGYVKNGSATGAIDISTIAKVLKKAANNLVLIDLNIN